MLRFLKLLIAGRHRWSRCWMGFHPWDMPGGHCEKCGKCDEFLGPHPSCEARGRVTDVDKVVNALLLTDVCMTNCLEQDVAAVERAVAGWTADQRARAFDWAMAEHFSASDNDVLRLPCPAHVRVLRPDYGGRR